MGGGMAKLPGLSGPDLVRAALKRAIPERDFQAQVLDIARLFGWRLYHALDSRGSEPGFPDCVLVKDGRLIFAELKTELGAVEPDQQAWLDDLGQVKGVEVHLWRPRDLDAIETTLRRSA